MFTFGPSLVTVPQDYKGWGRVQEGAVKKDVIYEQVLCEYEFSTNVFPQEKDPIELKRQINQLSLSVFLLSSLLNNLEICKCLHLT